MPDVLRRMTPLAWACLGVAAVFAVAALVLPVTLATRGLSIALVVLAVARWRTPPEAGRIARGAGFDCAILVLLAIGAAYLSFNPAL